MATHHVELPGSHRPAKGDAKRLRDADPQARVEVTLTLRGPRLPDADHLPSAPLSPEQYKAQYGASSADAERVAQVLGPLGIKVDEISLPTRSVRVSGSVAAMEDAFHANLGIYHSASQGQFRGREGSLQVPQELAGIVTGVFGLDQRRVAHRKASAVEPMPMVAQALSPFSAAELESRYSFPAGDARNQTVAIAEFGGGYFPDDVSAYCTKQGRPTPNITIQPVNLQALTLAEIQQLPPDQQQQQLDMSAEVMMDIEIVAGLCSKADIIVYFATFDQKGWVDLINQVVAGKPALPVALSVSWGLAEDAPDWSAAARDAINTALNAAALQGVTVCVASGDDGSGDQMTDSRGHVDFPSSSPFVLSVGGTMVTGTTTHSNEVVWWQSPGRRTSKGGGATGGGVSTIFARPKWQNVTVKSINPGSIDGRVVPDVSALSGPPMYDLIMLGQDSPNGGTSASTPLWAALLARINAGLPAARQDFGGGDRR
jgi:kumamolisin